MPAKKDAVVTKKPVAKKSRTKEVEAVAKETEATTKTITRNTSVLFGIVIAESGEDRAHSLHQVVIPKEDGCKTVQDIKDAMVKREIIGSVYIVREQPITRAVKEIIEFK